jgi:hypothetical protein
VRAQLTGWVRKPGLESIGIYHYLLLRVCRGVDCTWPNRATAGKRPNGVYSTLWFKTGELFIDQGGDRTGLDIHRNGCEALMSIRTSLPAA